MTSLEELRQLQADLAHYQVKVTYSIGADGWIDWVFICGKGIQKESWGSVLSAAEYMRRIRREREIETLYGQLPLNKGKRFSNGRWRNALA